MRAIIVLLLCLSGSIWADDTLSVMTYNIQGMKPGTDPETRLFHIIQKLKTLEPDIIGLQEINETPNGGGVDNQARRITDSLSAHFGVPFYYYTSFTHLSWNNQFREMIGIVSRYPVQDQGFLQLVRGTFPRKVVWNAIDTPLGRVNFFNTHLSFNSASIRRQQVQQIIPYIAQQEAAHPGIASILTGDFNDPPGSQTILYLTASGPDTFFVDTFAEANPGNPGYTVPANAPDTRIDYIFHKNTGRVAVADSRVVMDQPYTGNTFCSDHLGVLTRFTLLPTAIEGRGAAALPERIRLFQNYPNPFNPETTIAYRLSDAGPITLGIYTLLGQTVRKLVDQTQPAGSYSVRWDGRDARGEPVSAGVYFALLRGNGFSAAQKMLVVR